jgi:hypothetical protein
MERIDNATTVSGDLTLAFEKVMGREPNPDRAEEGDFRLTREDLGGLAESV